MTKYCNFCLLPKLSSCSQRSRISLQTLSQLKGHWCIELLWYILPICTHLRVPSLERRGWTLLHLIWWFHLQESTWEFGAWTQSFRWGRGRHWTHPTKWWSLRTDWPAHYTLCLARVNWETYQVPFGCLVKPTWSRSSLWPWSTFHLAVTDSS